MHACTIVARNYLAHARVLAESFLAHNPGGRFTTLVLDAEDLEHPNEEPFRVVSPYEIGLEPAELHRMAMIYDVLEIATAVKPWFLRSLLAHGDDVTYFDPDIRVYAPVDDISGLAREHRIVLVPHLMEPIPRDDRVPSEETILAAGVFNLGFVAVGRGAEPFLDWWSERLARDCFLDFEAGQFVDQRWIDLVPGLFEHVILRDPGADVAHWNVFARDLRQVDGAWLVDGVPLRFYHFTGFNPHRPWLASRHQGSRPRVRLSERPDLARLYEEYAAELLAHGYDRTRTLEYRFDRLPGGLAIDKRMRRLYRDELVRAERKGGQLPPDPFDARAAGAFVEWLNAPEDPVGGAASVSRYLAQVRRERADLQTAFPDLRWSDAERYLAWVAADGRHQASIPAELVPSPPASRSTSATAAPRLEEGINVAGYLRAELGVGEAARQIIEGVKAAGIPFSTVVYRAGTSSRQEHPFEGAESAEPIFDTNLVCVNADRLREFAYDMGPDFFRGRYTIGVWWWEVDVFPPVMHPAFDVVDEIWVGSDHIRSAISKETDKPVLTIPIPVRIPAVEPLSRAELGLPEGFLFLFSFDFFSITDRKNPIGLVEAFKRAFPRPGSGPTLVVKSINGDKVGVRLEELRAATAGRPDIKIVDRYVSAHEKNSLMATCDCYVSLHRSEGFGLTMAEAMAFGKPVIATGYSGNLEFMTEENSYLVPHGMTRVPPGADPYPTGAQWAEPDLTRAAELMRHVYENPEEARAKGARARRELAERQSPERLGEFVSHRMAEIRELRRTRPPTEVPDEVFAGSGDPLARAASVVARGPGGIRAQSSHVGAPAVLLRRVLNRALFPYIAEQHDLHRALVDVVTALDARARAAEEVERALRGRVESLERQLGDVVARARGATADVARLDAELTATPYAARPEALRTRDPHGRPAIGFASADGDASGYVGFEDVFRGPEDFIRERQRVYLEVVGDRAPVVDVGSGRGEFLDLMREAGIPATGVDLDVGMVEHARAKGHQVALGDGVAHLEGLDDASLGVVFSAQLIEHLAQGALVEFLDVARRKLKPGGLFVAETVNPHSIQAFKAYWTDRTHEPPIFPEVAVTLCRLAGFESAWVLFPNGSGDLERDRTTTGEYAVVASA